MRWGWLWSLSFSNYGVELSAVLLRPLIKAVIAARCLSGRSGGTGAVAGPGSAPAPSIPCSILCWMDSGWIRDGFTA